MATQISHLKYRLVLTLKRMEELKQKLYRLEEKERELRHQIFELGGSLF